VLLESPCRRKQDGFVSVQPEQPLESLQYSWIVIDDQNDVPILQDIPDLSADTQLFENIRSEPLCFVMVGWAHVMPRPEIALPTLFGDSLNLK
jgi:hypothetical protein